MWIKCPKEGYKAKRKVKSKKERREDPREIKSDFEERKSTIQKREIC